MVSLSASSSKVIFPPSGFTFSFLLPRLFPISFFPSPTSFSSLFLSSYVYCCVDQGYFLSGNGNDMSGLTVCFNTAVWDQSASFMVTVDIDFDVMLPLIQNLPLTWISLEQYGEKESVGHWFTLRRFR